MDAHTHWESVHAENEADEVSWWLPAPRTSLRLLAEAAPTSDARIVDVGCGQAGIAGALLATGYQNVASLDISHAAIEKARGRLGAEATRVEWIEADVRTFRPESAFDVWHDRAVFHFLVEPADREAYAATLRRALAPDGHAIIATFAPDGPEKCSGLPVARYDPQGIAAALGLRLVHGERETHVTPWGAEQRFAWALLRA